jgi:protein TonB
MIARLEDRGPELRRWLLSAAIVLVAHGALAAAVLHWPGDDDGDDATAAMVISLSPMPVAASLEHQELPDGPEQADSEASPEVASESVEDKLVEKVETRETHEVIPELDRMAEPEIALAALPPELKEEAPKRMEYQAPSIAAAPKSPQVEEVATLAAPNQGQAHVARSDAVPTWKRQIVNLIERNKRYPAAAQARGDRGTAVILFTLDRKGRVVSSRVVKTSGSSALDQEAIEVVRRVQPFPAPPEQMTGQEVSLTLPMKFIVR